MANLDSFVSSSRPPPQPITTSQEIRDRGSTFVASIYRASTVDEAKRAAKHVKNVVHANRPASHEIFAWRCMVLKVGKTGLGGPEDFEIKAGSEDDGEQYAGGRVLKVMQAEAVIDAVVVVSRWFGGEMLGPARFTHIETCTRQVCQTFLRKEEVEESISTLGSLDDILATLRSELAEAQAGTQSDNLAPPKAVPTRPKVDYNALRKNLDVTKAKRLITARENSIKSVKMSLKKIQEKGPALEEQVS